MAAKPWETRLTEKSHCNVLEMTPTSKMYSKDSPLGKNAKSSDSLLVKVRKNNVSTRISARPPVMWHMARSSSSQSSGNRYDDSSVSSSFCTSTTPVSGFTGLASERTVDSSHSRLSYMTLTESTKAKQKNRSHHSRAQRQSMDESQFLKNSVVFSDPSR